MLWLDSRNAFTSDHTLAKVLTEVEARISAEGCRVTFKDQHTYVFDVVAEDQVDLLLKAAAMSIVAEKAAREATPVPEAAPEAASLYEEYERHVRSGAYVAHADGHYIDDEGDRIEDPDFEGGYARRGHHKRDPGSPGNRPKDPTKFDVKAGLEGFEAVTSVNWATDYASVGLALGSTHTDDGDGWHVSTGWWIEFHDGEKVRVSDWDQSSAYDDELPDPEDIRAGRVVYWRIEGSEAGVRRVAAMVGA